MLEFEFNTKVTDRILTKLLEARKFIRIALFQIHNQLIFDVLLKKLEEGVKIEIFTLPYDSINQKIQNVVIPRFSKIQEKGAILYFCKWNVGDPGRTTTAVGRWYAFHGKFIVTDKCAIALSANFTEHQELDAILIYENEMKIKEYNQKFDELLDLFIKKNSGFDGSLRQKIIDTKILNIYKVFVLPDVIETSTHENNWIQHYPTSLCPTNVPIQDKLYLTPFDCRGGDFYESIISEAEKFAYVSAESFTDECFSNFLIQQRLRGIEIKILSGAGSMDKVEKMKEMFHDLSAHGILVRNPQEDLHAKLILTDKRLAVSSINLNKMNLGFTKTKQFWRENTESIDVCSDPKILKTAKVQFLEIFDKSVSMEVKLAEKIQKLVSNAFSQRFGLKTKKEVKLLFARLIVGKEIEIKKFITDLCQITSKLMEKSGRCTVTKDDFIMALILYYLSERKHDYDQLNEKLSILESGINTSNSLNALIGNGFIEKEGDFFKLKLNTLLK